MASHLDAHPLWMRTPVLHGEPAPPGVTHADVVVVGAGLTGMTTALGLQRRGFRVVVVDRRGAGQGQSGSTTSHCTAMLDTGYAELLRTQGLGAAAGILHAQLGALDTLEANARALAPGSFTRAPAYALTEAPSGTAALQEELEALRRLGAEDVRWEEGEALPWKDATGGVRWARHGHLSPRAYLDGLLRAFLGAGGRFFEGVAVRKVYEGTPCRLDAGEVELRAEQVVLATHELPFLLRLIPRLPAYRTYAMAMRAGAGFPDALMSDDAEPYHYVRLEVLDGKRWAIIGGEDHKVGHDDAGAARWDRLEAWARARFPVGAVEARWSGQILEPFDGLPLIGAPKRGGHLRVATGYAGNGVTWATVAAEILTAQVLGEAHPLEALVSPRRLALRRHWSEFVKENLDFPRQLVRDRMHRPQPLHGELAPGEGRVVRVADHDVAISREADGTLHAVSAICTHMACRVAFNDAEKSWDCPCHGSRFALDGAVLNGPATVPLKAMALDEDADAEEEADRRPGYGPELLSDPGV